MKHPSGPRKRFEKRFNFALTSEQHALLHRIAALSNDEAAEVLRRMIEREAPFFLYYASVNKKLPANGDQP